MRLLQFSAYALAIGLAIGLAVYAAFNGFFGTNFDLSSNGYRIAFLAILAMLGGVAAQLHRKESKFAKPAKLAFLFLGLCGLIHLLNMQFGSDSLWELLYVSHPPEPSRLEYMAYWLSLDIPAIAPGIAAIIMAVAMHRVYGPNPQESGTPSRSGIRGRWVFAGLLLLVWPSLNNVLDTVLPVVNHKLDDWGAIEFVSFAVLTVVIASLRKERWVVDGEGVKFVLGTRTIFSAKWRRIQQIVVIHQANGKETFIVHYRTRFLIPFSVVFRPESVLGGEAMADLIRGSAMEEGLKIVHFRASRTVVLTGWTLILAGCALIPFRNWLENDLHLQYVDGRFNAANYAEFAAVLPLSLFYLANIALLSLGFGLNSGARFGGSRIFLLTIWMAGLAYLETPALHWLVWIAIYSIETAIMTPHTVLPALQYPPLLEFGFDVATWGFALAPLFFWIGVAAGRRRWRPQEETVLVAKAQTTEEREGPMLVAS